MKRKNVLYVKLLMKYLSSLICLLMYFSSFLSTSTVPLDNVICACVSIPLSACFLYSTKNDEKELHHIRMRERKQSRRRKKCEELTV